MSKTSLPSGTGDIWGSSASIIATDQQLATKSSAGWGNEIASPSIQNKWEYDTDLKILNILEGGYGDWNTNVIYYKGSRALYNGVVVVSRTNNNKGNQPTIQQNQPDTNWVRADNYVSNDIQTYADSSLNYINISNATLVLGKDFQNVGSPSNTVKNSLGSKLGKTDGQANALVSYDNNGSIVLNKAVNGSTDFNTIVVGKGGNNQELKTTPKSDFLRNMGIKIPYAEWSPDETYSYGDRVTTLFTDSSGNIISRKWVCVQKTGTVSGESNSPETLSFNQTTGVYDWFNTVWRRESKRIYFKSKSNPSLFNFDFMGDMTWKGTLKNGRGAVQLDLTSGGSSLGTKGIVTFADLMDQYGNTLPLNNGQVFSRTTSVSDKTKIWEITATHLGAVGNVNVIVLQDAIDPTNLNLKGFGFGSNYGDNPITIGFSMPEFIWTAEHRNIELPDY